MKPHSSLAWAAIVLSLCFGIAGIAHTTAVISVALGEGKPYDFRLVSLLATGGVLIYPGLISNIGIGRVDQAGASLGACDECCCHASVVGLRGASFTAHHSNQVLGVIVSGLFLLSS